MVKEQYMTVEDVCALSFHQMWDGRQDYSEPGYSLPVSALRKWLGLGLIRGERFPSDNSYGYTWGIPTTELPKIREFFNKYPDTKKFPKVSRLSENFITWSDYMDSKGEKHI